MRQVSELRLWAGTRTAAMLDEVIVILVFGLLATSALLALRAAACSLWTAAATLSIAFVLTPALWLASDLHVARPVFDALRLARSEPFADFVLLYPPMSFFVATLIAACLTSASKRILKAVRADPRPGARKPST